MKYRSEIDGLRALAVLPVVLFHAGHPNFDGGFIGVDVFFVISGYLITSIILDALKNDRFSTLEFYERRVRRILPVLILVLLTCIPLAWILMTPVQMKDFSRSLISVSFFISNFFFMRETGYFSASSEEMPLLHTWSLSVEEQYYVVFPLLVFVLYRYFKRQLFFIILVSAMISFSISEWGWRYRGDYNFFFTPSRIWELLVGSISAVVSSERRLHSSNTLSLLGLALILFSIFFFDKDTPFPSAYALVPVIGTALIILFSQSTVVGKFLGTKPLVSFGLISYSLYLWHQPIFAFARLGYFESIDQPMMLMLVGVAILLSYCSWRFVELPFRDQSKVNTRKLGFVLFSAFLIIFCFGWGGKRTEGYEKWMLEYKYTTSERNLYSLIHNATSHDVYGGMHSDSCHIWVRNSSEIDLIRLEHCHQEFARAIVVLGDSHAMNLFNIVAQSGVFNFVIGISQGGCRPNDRLSKCHYFELENFLKSHKDKIGKLIYHQAGAYFVRDRFGRLGSDSAFDGEFSSIDTHEIKRTFEYLEGLATRFELDVLWVGPFVEYRYRPLATIEGTKGKSVNPRSIEIFTVLNIELERIADSAQKIEFSRFSDIFHEPISAFDLDCFMFRDTDHYSRCGELVIARKSTASLRKLSWLPDRQTSTKLYKRP